MSTQSRRLRVATAIASVTAGLSAMALAATLDYSPPDHATHAALQQRVARAHPFLSALSSDVKPPAPTPVGDVEIGPVTYTLLRPPPLARVTARAPCHSGWRDLESGPAGREVYFQCAGDKNPIPAPRAESQSALELLPNPADLHGPLPALEADPAARANLADEAAANLRRDLAR
jgi:hypothetical protein